MKVKNFVILFSMLFLFSCAVRNANIKSDIGLTIYYLQMSNSYTSVINENSIKKISTVKLINSKNRLLIDSLSQIIYSLDTSNIIKTQNFIDARVLIEVKEFYTVSISRTGVLYFKGHVYRKDIQLINFLERNFKELNWVD